MRSKQSNASTYNNWEEARLELIEQENDLLKQKESLGIGSDVTIETFLSDWPRKEDGQAKTSNIIQLQEAFGMLAERKKILDRELLVIEELNKRHAIVRIDQTYILTEKRSDIFDGMDFVLESKQSLKLYYEDEMVLSHNGKPCSKADIWLRSPLRHKYDGITFDPNHVGPVNGRYNIWKGFAVAPVKRDCSLYWAHVYDNICLGVKKMYDYVRKWGAYVFQYPNKVHSALVICGLQGVGKNMFVDPLGFLLGPHYIKLSSLSELLSHFNAHLKNGVLINANEALWGGNKKETGALKAIITESTFLCEAKGKDAIQLPNYRHIVITSNEDWPVDLDADDRRFFVVKVAETHKENHSYFKAIQEQLSNGGYEALLYDLLNEDLTGFDPRVFPISLCAFDIKMRSAKSVDRYIYHVLSEAHSQHVDDR